MTIDVAAGVTSFTCKNCGATTSAVAHGASIRCAFCGSEHVIARTDDPETPQAEALIPFAFPDDQVERVYRTWLGEGFFRPRDLTATASNHAMRAVYLPVWDCRGEARSTWTAEAGHNRTREVKDQGDNNGATKTRTVTETDWRPARGTHDGDYPRLLISASKGLPQTWIGQLGEFDFGQLKSYAPEYLVGREVESSALDRTAALTAAREQIEQQEESACAALVPGDTHRNLRVQTTFEAVDGRMIYLPIWLASFQYNGKLYRCAVNGQSGNVTGEAPVAKARVAAALAAVVAVLTLIVILITLL